MYCSNCGKELKDDAVFCDKCGTKVGEVPEQKNVTLWQDIKSFVSKNRKIIFSLCLIVCAFLVLGSVINLIQTGGSTDSWRGPDAGMSKSTAPRDIMFIVIGCVGGFISVNNLKKK